MADPAAQQIIPGQVPITIDHAFALTIENLSCTKSAASAVAYGFAGPFGSRDGQPTVTFTFEMPPLATGFEVDLSVLYTRKTWEYTVGAVVYTLVNARVTSDSTSVDQLQGNTRTTFQGNAFQRLPA